MHDRAPLTALAAIALLTTMPASAAPSSYAMNWSDSVSSGHVVDGVTVSTSLAGGATLFSASPSGPWIGHASGDDATITFDSPVAEFCVYVWWNDTGESVTISTDQTSGNVLRGVDTGGGTTTVTGSTFTWSSMGTSDVAAMCVGNAGGISSITYDHNGTGNGLVFGDNVLLDSGVCTSTTWYLDDDGDGHGTADFSVAACTAPTDHVASSDDCNDDDDSIYPGATEVVGDEVDQSCDGAEVCYVDADGDGYRVDGVVSSVDVDCADPGEAAADAPAGDCDDAVDSVYPGAVEVAYDGVDQDCDGGDLCDVDLDGFDHRICGGTDCDDAEASINPVAAEVWYDGVDGDCDGWSDYDADYDGFDSGDGPDADCDDTDDAVNPDAEERWYDGVDQDCDEASDFDGDGDGYDAIGHGGEDCDDSLATVYPTAPELEDGLDNDCNGLAEGDDLDGDGLADELELRLGLDPDSDDSDGDGVPDRDELVAGEAIDTDRDGIIDALDADDDGDGVPTADERGDGVDPADSDSDGVPDYLDDDSDNDGFSDQIEGSVDSDFDGLPDRIDADSDDDSVPDADEVDGDSDADGQVDRLDADDDGDGFSTFIEQGWSSPDLDGDGVENYLDDDSDGDGIGDAEEGLGDADCDDLPNVQDADDADGPCLNLPTPGFGSAACTGASSSGVPAGGLALVLLGLLGARRRRG